MYKVRPHGRSYGQHGIGLLGSAPVSPGKLSPAKQFWLQWKWFLATMKLSCTFLFVESAALAFTTFRLTHCSQPLNSIIQHLYLVNQTIARSKVSRSEK